MRGDNELNPSIVPTTLGKPPAKVFTTFMCFHSMTHVVERFTAVYDVWPNLTPQ